VSAARGVALVRESGSRDELHLDGLERIRVWNDNILHMRAVRTSSVTGGSP
jgi:hypothetical protein